MVAFLILDRTYLAEQKEQKRPIAGSDNNSYGIPVWWRTIWKYVALYSAITLFTWVFVRAAIPFAALSTSTDSSNNTETEQYAIGISLFGVVSGSITALWVRIDNDRHIWNLSLCYMIILIIFFWIAFDKTGLWKWNGANILVVALVFAMRFIDGFVTPILFANIDRRYHKEFGHLYCQHTTSVHVFHDPTVVHM